MTIELHQFYRDKETREVFFISNINKKSGAFTADHCVRDYAYTYGPEDTRSFLKSHKVLTDKERDRVEILTDLILQMNANKFKAIAGHYAVVGNEPLMDNHFGDPDTQVQELVQKARSCDVCAIGGMFLAAVNLHDKVTLSDINCHKNGGYQEHYDDSSKFTNYLSKWFSTEECRLMEFAFEGDDIRDTYTHSDEVRNVVQHFRFRVLARHIELFSFKEYDTAIASETAEMEFVSDEALRKVSDIFLREIIANTVLNAQFKPEKGLAPL